MPESAPSLTGNQIRDTFLQFFAEKRHAVLPSASLIPEDPTVLLTIAGMLPFKPIFLGQKQSEHARATTSQKCIRTNDIENVGRTARHHTFFEMLGNFSFGDYFKVEAIQWAWELLTDAYRLPPDRLVVSVFEDDDEAFAIWRDKVGIPAERIQRMGAKDNFWAAGPTGPCGPCSEIYYDFHPELGDKNIDLEDDSRFIELYNLVFMEYNRDANDNLTPLQKKNIDTGMGLERMAQVLQQVSNNYETDLIFPIIKTAADIAEVDYNKAKSNIQTSLKVIGDHTRAIVHMIADGITASNLGRGYVLRRLIRRVVRHGRLIGIGDNFTVQVAETAIALSEAVYPNLRERDSIIKNELQREEAAFVKTLGRGEKLLADLIKNVKKPSKKGKKTPTKKISGVDAFTLYDTYGFPLELTQEIAEEQGISVDKEGFNQEMQKQQERSKSAHETIDLTVQGSLDCLAEKVHPTEFSGYRDWQGTATVTALLIAGESVEIAEAGAEIQIVVDQTPFYAESGGQVGDRGYCTGESFLVRIEDVQKESGIFIHFGCLERGTLKVGDPVMATIDRSCRRRAQAHHTATHLLQAALKKTVGDSVSQAGSLVDFDRLRFDFNCPHALTPEELSEIESQINLWIAEAHETQTEEMALEEAKRKGAIAMFGEKYDAEVRVVDVPGVSMELCGGTHVNNTAEIGLFKIISETGIAAGIRRIEAVAGPAVLGYLNERDMVVKQLCDRFKLKPEEILGRVITLQTELKDTQKALEKIKQELALTKSDQLLSQAETIGKFQVLVAQLEGIDASALMSAAEKLQQKLGKSAVVLGSVPSEGKVSLVAAFSPEIHKGKKLPAGKFIGDIAKICGGGGGGRPNLAQAGGRKPDKLAEALSTAQEKLQQALS